MQPEVKQHKAKKKLVVNRKAQPKVTTKVVTNSIVKKKLVKTAVTTKVVHMPIVARKEPLVCTCHLANNKINKENKNMHVNNAKKNH